MDPVVATFMEGMGTAAATAGFLNQLQGRIFGLLYLQEKPMSLDEIAQALQQSKSNVSVSVRKLVDWRLAQRVRLEGSRKDHYVAATNFWQVVVEIMERRFRWNVRQVIAASEEAQRLADELGPGRKGSAIPRALLAERLDTIRNFFQALDGVLSSIGRETPPFGAQTRSSTSAPAKKRVRTRRK
jgi:DNA-binding transcriptional regulator GbsR (MarR family)